MKMVKGDLNSSELAIPVLSILFLVLAVMGIFYYLFTHPNTAGMGVCPAGFCPTNIWNGTKRCGASLYEVGFEVCNPQYSCTNAQTPFPYYDESIGTVNDPLNATCPTGTNCQCMNAIYCPSDITTFWQVNTSYSTETAQTATNYLQYNVWQDQFGNYYTTPFNIGAPSLQMNSCLLTCPQVLSGQLFPGCDTSGVLYTKQCLTGYLVYFDMCTEEGECSTFDEYAQGNFACVNDPAIPTMMQEQNCFGYDKWPAKLNGTYVCYGTSALPCTNVLPCT